jgi:hypothetical protein
MSLGLPRLGTRVRTVMVSSDGCPKSFGQPVLTFCNRYAGVYNANYGTGTPLLRQQLAAGIYLEERGIPLSSWYLMRSRRDPDRNSTDHFNGRILDGCH